MAATFNWSQTYGTSPGTTVDLGESGNLFNFKNQDDANITDDYLYPITLGNYSYEIWLRAHFTGTFSSISNIQFWMSTNFSPSTDLTIRWKGNGQTSYVTPVNIASTVATVTVPTSDPGTANVSIGGSLGGSLAAPGYSNYIVLQVQVGSSAIPGNTSKAIFTLQYDET